MDTGPSCNSVTEPGMGYLFCFQRASNCVRDFPQGISIWGEFCLLGQNALAAAIRALPGRSGPAPAARGRRRAPWLPRGSRRPRGLRVKPAGARRGLRVKPPGAAAKKVYPYSIRREFTVR